MVENPPHDRPALFDNHLLAQRRDRAHGLGFLSGADFLHNAALESIEDRLSFVTRDFKSSTLVGAGSGAAIPELAGQRWDEVLESSASRAIGAGALPWKRSETLPFEAESRDLIISMLELHWSNDLVGQLIQMRRALRPDGLMLAALFGGQTLHELRGALTQAEVEVSGGLSPRIAPMAELRDLGALLQRAGFALPVADTERVEVTYPDIWSLMRDLRAMGETNILAARRRTLTPRRLFTRADEIYREAYPAQAGRIRATFEIVFLTGWAPAASQQQPLRPGSAKMRLAEALGTTEQPAGEKAGKPTAE